MIAHESWVALAMAGAALAGATLVWWLIFLALPFVALAGSIEWYRRRPV